MFIIICQLSALTVITSQPSKEKQLNRENQVLIGYMFCDEWINSQVSMEYDWSMWVGVLDLATCASLKV